jgi:hypothetical protein
MIGVGMIGIDREDLAVSRFRILKFPDLMGAKTFLDERIQLGVLFAVIRNLIRCLG